MTFLKSRPWLSTFLFLLALLGVAFVALIIRVYSAPLPPYVLRLLRVPHSQVIYDPAQPEKTYSYGSSIDFHTGEYKVDKSTIYLPWQEGVEQIELETTLILNHDVLNDESDALLALFDYQQVPVTLAGESKLVHLFEVEPYSAQKIDFTIMVPNLPGRHKLWIYNIQAADLHHLDSEFRQKATSFAHGTDFDVVIGETSDFPQPDYQPAPPSQESPSGPESGWNTINREADRRTFWITDTVKSKQLLDFNIHVAHNILDEVPYALVALLDWQQIPLGDESPTYFGLIGKQNGLQTLPATVQIPSTGTVHELQVIYFIDPYRRLDETQDGIQWGGSSESQRVGLIKSSE
ncbi:MAG: hypothetical protein ACPGWR_26810 [Ardenticatenaceae bacterium]